MTKIINFGIHGTKVYTATDSTLIKKIGLTTTTLQPFIDETEWTTSEAETLVEIMTREEIARNLQALEQKYGIPSEDFYNRWQAGKSPVEGIDKLRWVVLWEAWRHGSYQLPQKP